MTSTAQPQIEQCCQQFQALSDRTRVRILELLRSGEKCVCELIPALGVRQSLLSFHLKTLKNAGLVTDRKEGRWVHYSIDWNGLDELQKLISVLKQPSPETACCEAPDTDSCSCNHP